MEVGIEDCLHIEFEYNKSKYVLCFRYTRKQNQYISDARLVFVFVTFSCRYHVKDVIVGKIYFVLVRIKIRHMEIDIIKRESAGSGPNVYHENETIAKYEIMDGAPVRGEKSGFLVFTVLWGVSVGTLC